MNKKLLFMSIFIISLISTEAYAENCDPESRFYWSTHDGCRFFYGGSSMWAEEIEDLSNNYQGYFKNINGYAVCDKLWPFSYNKRENTEAYVLTLYLNIVSGGLQLDALIAGAINKETDSFTRLGLDYSSTINKTIVKIEEILASFSSTDPQLGDAKNVARRIASFYRIENPNKPKCIYGCKTDDECDDKLYCNGQETCKNKLCIKGTPINCNDNIKCTDDSCNEQTDSCNNIEKDANCNDGLYCNGIETCDAVNDCQDGTNVDCSDNLFCTVNERCDENLKKCLSDKRDCSNNNLPEIAKCDNDPDNKPFTWDYRQAFTSVCNEVNDKCTTGDATIAHTCNMANCNADCEDDNDCNEGEICNLDSCTCILECIPKEESCDGEDNDCDGLIDEGFPDYDNDKDGCDYDEHPLYCGADCVDEDEDNDGVLDIDDNCQTDANKDQADNDEDGLGDVCDEDDDNDGAPDEKDDYPFDPNRWVLGDLNGDGKVSALDLIVIINAMGTEPGDPNWNELADVNKDGKVNGLDWIIIRNKLSI